MAATMSVLLLSWKDSRNLGNRADEVPKINVVNPVAEVANQAGNVQIVHLRAGTPPGQ